MANKAGIYTERLTRMVWTPDTDQENGQDVPNWVAGGTLWGSVEETNGRRDTAYSATQTGADAEIRLRNYPDIGAQDHLIDTYSARWVIDYVYEGDNEMILQVHRFDGGLPEGA